MNEAQFLLSLGGVNRRHSTTIMPCPAYIGYRANRVPSAMIESKEEIDSFLDHDKTAAQKSFPSRSPGAKQI